MSGRLLIAAELADRLALSTSTVLDWFEARRRDMPTLKELVDEFTAQLSASAQSGADRYSAG
jgi:hypothetical protein